MRLLGAHAQAGQQQIEGAAGTDHTREALRATATRNQSESGLGQRKQGIGSGTPDVAGQRQFQAAAHAKAMDRRNDGLLGAIERFDPA
jgi:hypothetical protein